MTADELTALRDTLEGNLIMYHFSLGMHIHLTVSDHEGDDRREDARSPVGCLQSRRKMGGRHAVQELASRDSGGCTPHRVRLGVCRGRTYSGMELVFHRALRVAFGESVNTLEVYVDQSHTRGRDTMA
jgi:hypothetical protein